MRSVPVRELGEQRGLMLDAALSAWAALVSWVRWRRRLSWITMADLSELRCRWLSSVGNSVLVNPSVRVA